MQGFLALNNTEDEVWHKERLFIKFCDAAATCPCSPTAQTTVVTVFSVYYKWLN